MKTIWGRSLLLGLFLFCVTSVGLGDDTVYDTIMQLCETELVMGATAVCETYPACVDKHGEESHTCLQDLDRDMLALCDDLACEKDSLLLITAIDVALDHSAYCIDPLERQTFADNLGEALQDYEAGNYQQAGDALLVLFDTYQHRFLPYIAALAYEEASTVEAALDSYQDAIAVQFFTPLVYYSRGNLYRSLGDAEHASRDFYTLNSLQNSDITALLSIPPNIPPYTLPTSETWIVYDLMEYFSGIATDIYIDGFTTPGFEVEIAWLDGGRTLAIKDLFTDANRWEEPIPDILFFDCFGKTCSLNISYQKAYAGLGSGAGTFIELNIAEDAIEIQQKHQGSEEHGETYQVMLPDTAFDPRPPVPCKNGVYPRLAVDETALTLTRVSILKVYAAPSEASEIIAEVKYTETELDVIGTLVCGEEGNWWPVALADGTSGWIREAYDRHYRVIPADMALSFDYLLDGWKG